MLEQGKSVRNPPPKEEGAAETMGDELTTTPIPHPPVQLQGEKAEKIRSKAELGRRKEWQKQWVMN